MQCLVVNLLHHDIFAQRAAEKSQQQEGVFGSPPPLLYRSALVDNRHYGGDGGYQNKIYREGIDELFIHLSCLSAEDDSHTDADRCRAQMCH